MTHRQRLRIGLGLVLLIGGACVTVAQDAPPADEPPPDGWIDPEAEQVLKKMSEHYRKADSLSGRITATLRVQAPGRTESYDAVNDFHFKRPLSFATVNAQGKSDCEAVCDGATLVTFVPSKNKYVSEPAPKSMHQVMERVSYAIQVTGSPSAGLESILLRALFAEDPGNALRTRTTQVKYLGLEEEKAVEGQPRKVHRIRFAEPSGYLDIWVNAGETPWLVRAMPNDPKTPSDLVKIQIALSFGRWSTGPLTADDFVFVPREGATRAGTLADAIGRPLPGPPPRGGQPNAGRGG